MPAPAEALEPGLGGAEGDALHRDVLDVDLQQRREAEIPEGGRHDDKVRLRDLVGEAEAGVVRLPLGQEGVPLAEGLRRQGVEGLLHEAAAGHFIVRAQVFQEGLGQPGAAGLLPPDAAVDVERLHACSSLLSR